MKGKTTMRIQIILLFFCFFNATVVLSKPQTPKRFPPQGKIILDVDAGADDAFGIILAVKNEKLFHGAPLIAITCVNGNTNLKNVEINVLRTLQQVEREDIPVYIGANESLVFTPPTDGFFGTDGFGDFPYDPNDLHTSQNEHAVLALIRIVNENPGEIILIALGPLTNVALAIKLDPTFISKLKEMVILGGTVAGVGNIRPGIEFNSFIDPEAFSIVLKASTYDKVTLLPWDTVVRANIPSDWRRELANFVHEDLVFLNKAEKATLWTSTYWHFGDPMAVAVFIWPKTIGTSYPYRTTSVTCGEARGGLLVDFYRADQNVTTSNVKIITDFDEKEFQRNVERIFKKKVSLNDPSNNDSY